MEVLKLTSGELEGISLEGIFISISSLQQMHKHIFINVDRIGVLNIHKRVIWFTFFFFCPELCFLYFWKTRVCEDMLIEILQYNNDIYQMLANDKENYLTFGNM